MITGINPHIQPKGNFQKHQQSFKGGAEVLSTAFNFLNTNPALGAVFVDVAFMDTPRTIVDTTRNPDAGVETAAREFSSTLNHSFAGLVGLGAGYLASQAFNKANGVKAHWLFNNNDSIDVFSKFIEQSKNGTTSDYYRNILTELQGYNPVDQNAPYKSLSKETIEEVTDLLSTANTSKYKIPSRVYNEAKFKIAADLGATENLKLTNGNFSVEGSLESILNDAFSLKKAFIDKANISNLTDAEFISGLKKLKTTTALGGLAIPIAIGMSLQPVNAYLTKKRTGKEGFVGNKDAKPDKSFGFKALKTLLGAGIAAGMLRTIAPFEKEKFLPKLQYKGMVPTIPQFKLIYATTIFSRMLAARNKDELRESSLKDTLGFVNWLILGGFVSKIAANQLDKSLINYDEKTYKAEGFKGLKKAWNWITKAEVKSHEELLYPALKKAGIDVLDANGKKLSYGKLMSELAKKAKSENADKKLIELYEAVSKRIKYKNIAQGLGYLYSGVVLGVGIPKLNIAITRSVEKSRAKKNAQQTQNIQTATQQLSSMTIPNSTVNKTFSSFLGSLN